MLEKGHSIIALLGSEEEKADEKATKARRIEEKAAKIRREEERMEFFQAVRERFNAGGKVTCRLGHCVKVLKNIKGRRRHEAACNGKYYRGVNKRPEAEMS